MSDGQDGYSAAQYDALTVDQVRREAHTTPHTSHHTSHLTSDGYRMDVQQGYDKVATMVHAAWI